MQDYKSTIATPLHKYLPDTYLLNEYYETTLVHPGAERLKSLRIP